MLLSSSFVAEENTQIVVHYLQLEKKKSYKTQKIHGKPFLSFMCLNLFISAYNAFANFV